MTEQLSVKRRPTVESIMDRFADERRPGRVIGSPTATGGPRRGVDREGVIGIDNGALRIQPMIKAGWGRTGINYGACERQNGLAFAVYMLNGHNTAQLGSIGESLKDRLRRWWVGSETYGRKRRIWQWLASGRILRAIRQFRWWMNITEKRTITSRLDENLAVGWFQDEVPSNPIGNGNAFVMHATGPENGELWANVAGGCLPAVRSVQNLPIYYVVILRERGASYYAASLPGANGLTAYPFMRPIAIDFFNETSPLYPGVHQAVLGQIGFRLDTRVYGARLELLPDYSKWFGSAHAADRLEGSGSLCLAHAEVGGEWSVFSGDFERAADGARAIGPDAVAILAPSVASGLIHTVYRTGSGENVVGLLWRFRDQDNFWRLRITDKGCALAVREKGVWTEVESTDRCTLRPSTVESLQVLDDGASMALYLGTELLFGKRFQDTRLREGTGVGIYSSQSDTRLRSFEAHPRAVPLPGSLRMGEPWLRKGTQVLVADDFVGSAAELSNRKTSVGGKTWRKDIGTGIMALCGDGTVKIQATAQRPNPGRTAYMVAWDHPDFADVSVGITPAGSGPGEREHGLCGLIFWQDPDNYITINIWVNESYGGASISCFFQTNGFEDLYDAIWSNVGRRVYYGVPMTLRVVLDGKRYAVFVNDEPVLYRALRDVYPEYENFSINRVGLLANWEWGNDTGSSFRDFVGKV